jgi:hypothetical protein
MPHHAVRLPWTDHSRLRHHERTEPAPNVGKRDAGTVALIHFGDASRTNYWRCFLPFSKPSSPIAIDVNAREFFAVTVVHSDAPVPVPAALVAMDVAVSIRSGNRSFYYSGHWIL